MPTRAGNRPSTDTLLYTCSTRKGEHSLVDGKKPTCLYLLKAGTLPQLLLPYADRRSRRPNSPGCRRAGTQETIPLDPLFSLFIQEKFAVGTSLNRREFGQSGRTSKLTQAATSARGREEALGHQRDPQGRQPAVGEEAFETQTKGDRGISYFISTRALTPYSRALLPPRERWDPPYASHFVVRYENTAQLI